MELVRDIKKQAKERSLFCIDATCPLVTKVHAEAIRYAKRGWQIILIGHRNHQEVLGNPRGSTRRNSNS